MVMDRAGLLIHRIFLMALGGLPLLILSFTLLCVWIAPLNVDDGGWVRIAAVLVMVEFILLHSGAFMAVGPVICHKRWQRLCWFLGFGLIYFGVIFGIAAWSRGSYVFWVLAGVVLSRLLTLVVLRDKRGTILLLQRSAVGMFILLLTAFIMLIPWPPLGITDEVRYAVFGVADDMLTEYPQRTIAWGILYFLLMAGVELVVGWNTPGWSDEQVDEAWEKLSGK